MMAEDLTVTASTAAAVTGDGRRWPRTVLVVVGCVVAVLGTLTVIAATFAMSFDAIRAVAVASGVSRDIAWMLPVSVDGAMAVATVVAILLHLTRRAVWYPLFVVACGVVFSVVCNAVHARPVVGDIAPEPLELGGGTAAVVSTIPALLLALSVHLLMTLVLAVLAPARAARHAATPRAVRTPRRPATDKPADTSPAVTVPADSDSPEEVPVSGPPRLSAARDVKARGVAMAAEGATAEQICQALDVSERTAYRYIDAARKTA